MADTALHNVVLLLLYKSEFMKSLLSRSLLETGFDEALLFPFNDLLEGKKWATKNNPDIIIAPSHMEGFFSPPILSAQWSHNQAFTLYICDELKKNEKAQLQFFSFDALFYNPVDLDCFKTLLRQRQL